MCKKATCFSIAFPPLLSVARVLLVFAFNHFQGHCQGWSILAAPLQVEFLHSLAARQSSAQAIKGASVTSDAFLTAPFDQIFEQ